MRIARFTSRWLPVGSLLALAFVTAGAIGLAQAQPPAGTRVALDGYCPVCFVEAMKWEKGSADHKALYDGQTYYFPNDAIKQKFVANPAKYVPALGGDCIVCYTKLGKRVPGLTEHAVRYDNRMYLFPGVEQQQVFLKDAQSFADVDLAVKGDCAVCLDHQGKRVAGKAEFTEIHNGLRYRFPSAEIQAEFRRDPARYSAVASKADNKSAMRSDRPAGKDLLTVTGKTGCAGCEHGVTPIQNPDELGLAVDLPNGKVVVVEQAHKLYPEVYKDRFAGQQVRVSGHVLKQDGQFTWIEPTSLSVVK
jgi:YHS domain-containing protein